MSEIVVVGSLNIDTTVRVRSLPLPGETVLGTGHFSDTGGKGANQAVAAARLGRSAAMIGKVGDDDGGRRLVEVLTAAGTDVSGIVRSTSDPTGMAMITVDERGENTIVVSPGANGSLTPDDVDRASDRLQHAVVTIAQLEVPIDAVARAALLTKGSFILNPAPAAALDHDLLRLVDVLVPNATELAFLASGDDPGSDIAAAGALAARIIGPRSIVVTLGARGALVVDGATTTHVPAPAVQAIDPTAAGDSFCAGLADGLVRGLDLVSATRWAVLCGAVTVTRWGAQSALPDRSDVEALEGAT